MDTRFPSDFLWGAGTSSYQIEGAALGCGKEESIWDRFCLKEGAIQNGDTGESAVDHYRLWETDIELLKQLKVNSYRFSISWPRFFPSGKINPEGKAFYDRLIDTLLEAKIEPMVTLYHWDLPQSLEDRGGWPERRTAEAFSAYARAAFLAFGDRVRFWITQNEPWVAATLGYGLGIHAPGRKDPILALKASHNLLLSHGMAVQEIRRLAKKSVKLGIALNLSPVYPKGPLAEAHDLRLNRFYLDGIFKGRYPEAIGFHPPAEEMKTISEPIDFLGINYYTRVQLNPDGEPIAESPNAYSSMWEFYPQGLSEIAERVWNEYKPKEILITENGTALDGIDDPMRIEYIKAHLGQISRLLEKKIPIQGYFAWSLLDNFEWAHGYGKRFGLVHVDYKTMKRTLKSSGRWYADIASA